MSKIIKFPIERTNPDSTRSVAGRADIVIFPGVRIERREFSLADRHPNANLLGRAKVASTEN